MSISSSTTIVYQNAPGSDDSDDAGSDPEDDGDQITANTPNAMGTTMIRSQTQHIDLLLSGGDSVPVSLKYSGSGSIELTSDMSY